MIAQAARKIAELLDIFQIDHANDPHTRDTPDRVARLFVNELMRGRFTSAPVLTSFEGSPTATRLIVIGPIEVRSTCAHHLLPIYGEAFIGVVPQADGSLVGLSKYDRVVSYFAARLQVQEELVTQIGHFIMGRTSPRGLAVRMSAVHMCRTHRGVRSGTDSRMVTSAYFGSLADDESGQAQFSTECLALSATR